MSGNRLFLSLLPRNLTSAFVGLSVAAFLPCSAVAHSGAGISLGCNGYNVEINDHVEHTGRIMGNRATFDNERYRVIKTAKDFILLRRGAQIRINRVTGKYVMYGPKGRKAPATEYSEPGGGGCLGN